MSAPELRPYQKDVVDRAAERCRAGLKRGIIQGSCGSGKSICAAHLAHRALQKNSRVLILADRRRLVKQFQGIFVAMGIEYGTIMADDSEHTTKPLVVGSIATLASWKANGREVPKFDLIIPDECISGDSIIPTNLGDIKMSDVGRSGATEVMSFDGQMVVWRKILRHITREERETIEITTANGKAIQCTPNHPIFSERGWIRADQIRIGDVVLTMGQEKGPRGGQNIEWRKMARCICANVAAASQLRNCRNSPANTGTSRRDMIGGLRPGITASPSKKGRQFSEHCWETQASSFLIGEVTPHESFAIMESGKRGGVDTRLPSCPTCCQVSASIQMEDTETRSSVWRPSARNRSWMCTNQCASGERRGFPINGSTELELLASLGGLEMTVRPGLAVPSLFTQRDTDLTILTSSRPGSEGTTVRSLSRHQKRDTETSTSRRKLEGRYCQSSKGTCLNSCSTSYERVESIRRKGKIVVYDIEVEGTHCFFANDILVHNCHRSLAETTQGILGLYPDAYVCGLTATPARNDGKSLGDFYQWIECMVSPSQLITEGHLIKPEVYAPPELAKKRGKGVKTKGLAGDPVSHWRRHADGLPTVAFCASVSAAAELADRFRNSGIPAEFVWAGISDQARLGEKSDRDGYYERLASGQTKVLCSVDLLVEGVDIPEVSAIIIWAKFGSLVKWTQATGRAMRPAPHIGKQRAIILDHSGAAGQHGLPGEDVEWSLDLGTTLGSRRKQALKDGKLAKPVMCPACGMIFSESRNCPSCNWAIPRNQLKGYGLGGTVHEAKDEILAKVNGFQEPGNSINYGAEWRIALRIAAAKGGTVGMAAGIFRNRTKSMPIEARVNPLPLSWSDWKRPVGEVFPEFQRKAK